MSRGHVKIGLLLPTTGVDSAQGTDTTKGFELHLKKFGCRAGGREMRVLKENDEAKPGLALIKIKALIEDDGVDFVVGPISSAVALAIRGYVHEHDTPLLVPAAFTRVLTSPQQASPNIFRLSETSDQANYPMGGWMMKNTRYRKVIVMAADFAGGRPRHAQRRLERAQPGPRRAEKRATQDQPAARADAVRRVRPGDQPDLHYQDREAGRTHRQRRDRRDPGCQPGSDLGMVE